jgi:hypothetical protein
MMRSQQEIVDYEVRSGECDRVSCSLKQPHASSPVAGVPFALVILSSSDNHYYAEQIAKRLFK